MKRSQEEARREMGNSLKGHDRFTHKPLAEPPNLEGGKEG